MFGLTRIPDASSYGLALLVIHGLGSSALAAQLHARRLGPRGVPLMVVYAAVLAVTAAWGLLLVAPARVFGTSPIGCLVWAPIGVGIGLITKWADRWIVRASARRRGAAPLAPAPSRGRDPHQRVRRVVPVSGAAPRRHPGLEASDALPATGLELGLWPEVAAGALEEIVYRGLLLQLALSTPGALIPALLVIATIFAFSLTHLWFGWTHVLAKLPLGALTTAVTLAAGSVIPALIAHVAFNALTHRDFRASPRVRESDNRGEGR